MNWKNNKIIKIGAALLLIGLPLFWVAYLTFITDFQFDAEAAKVVNKTSWQMTFGEHQYWYLWVNLGAVFFPFVLSFDKKVHYYKKWKFLLPAILIVGAFFIVWDIYFTELGVWGFNDRYFKNRIFGLPLGEWLFFVTIPYCCVFIHECLICYFPKDALARFDKGISISLIIIFALIGILNAYNAYTAWTFLLSAGFLLFHFLYVKNTYRTRFYLAYLISIIPFILINGILTGAFNEEPVVLYNNAHNLMTALGSRFITIPYDDFIYGFLLIMMNVTIYEGLRGYYNKHRKLG
jgi:lycopene cyclase domain-containing protein